MADEHAGRSRPEEPRREVLRLHILNGGGVNAQHEEAQRAELGEGTRGTNAREQHVSCAHDRLDGRSEGVGWDQRNGAGNLLGIGDHRTLQHRNLVVGPDLRMTEVAVHPDLVGQRDLEPVKAIEADATAQPNDRCRGRSSPSGEIADALAGDEHRIIEHRGRDPGFRLRELAVVRADRGKRSRRVGDRMKLCLTPQAHRELLFHTGRTEARRDMIGSALYDEIGVGYARYRRPDPRIAAAIDTALGSARTVLNVGAGTGSYEPRHRMVTAVEPSQAMIRQRPSGSAPCVEGDASSLGFADDSFDAAMAVLTVHHWPQPRRGLRELGCVASGVVVLTFDPAVHNAFWLFRDYIPAITQLDSTAGAIPVHDLADIIAADRIEPVPVPHDCLDGFGVAYWRRPERYLEAAVRRCISGFGLIDPDDATRGIERLRADLDSGRWHDRYRELLGLDTFDVGLRLVVRDVG